MEVDKLLSHKIHAACSRSVPFLEPGFPLDVNMPDSDRQEPTITIITVVYNGAELLEKTILSIKKQKNKNKNVRYIIIDGGSNDGTMELVKTHCNIIDYWISEKDFGIYDAMNKGWRLASDNSMILYLGAGDEILSLPCEDFIKNNADKIIYGSVILKNYTFKSSHGWRLKIGNTLHHQALLVPKKVHPSPPFNIKYPTYADYDFNSRLFNSQFDFINEPMLSSYAAPYGVSADLKILEMVTISSRNFGLFWGAISLIYFSIRSAKNIINRFTKF